MKAFRKSSLLLVGAVAVACMATAALAAPPAGKGKRADDDFVKARANTKGPRITPPKTEAEALATRRITESGIIEMQLPEDRMVNLIAVKRADGTVVLVHGDADSAHDHVESKGEIE